MDIVTRLKQFMEYLQISSSQFADACNIPRPTLSQILTGRNKKISDEVIAKFHEGYPTLSIIWLLFGEGPMTIGNSGSNQPLQMNHPASVPEHVDKPDSFDFEDNLSLFDDRNDIKQDFQAKFTPEQNFTVDTAPISKSTKKILRIMVFYTDNSFEVFSPSAD